MEAKTETLQKTHYNATLNYIHWAHKELGIFRVKPDFPIPPYKPGQYTTLGIGYWEPRWPGAQDENLRPGQEMRLVKRAYSIASPIVNASGELIRPEEEDFLEFYIVLVTQNQDGRAPALTPRLFLLQEGDRLYLGEKFTGEYLLEPLEGCWQKDGLVLFAATGTGEGPHNKMIWDLLRRGFPGRIVSVMCCRYEKDLAYKETYLKLAERYPNLTYITLTTREPSNRGRKVYIQDLCASGELEERIGQKLDPSTTHVYLCGNPAMIGIPKVRQGVKEYPKPPGVIEILEKRGFVADLGKRKGNIHFEKYW